MNRDSDPQDTIRGTAYTSPIPPLEDPPAPAAAGGPRYVRTEPIPSSAHHAAGRASGNGCYGFGGQVGLGLPFPGLVVTRTLGGRRPRKSLVLAAVLSLLLGPLGMVYSTFFGAFVMVGVLFWSTLFTGGDALTALWPLCALWAVWAAHCRNRFVRRLETSPYA